MTGFRAGLTVFLGGLVLILFNKSLAQLQKSIDELFGMGSPSIRFTRIVFYIAGAGLVILGTLFMFDVFHVES